MDNRAGDAARGGEEDQLVRELLRWFKHDFFEWFQSPKCPRCPEAADAMVCEGVVRPSTQAELQGEAGVVECYACPSCSYRERFPRFNNPVTLLSTRKGRCGEWANAFCLCLFAAGLEARMCIDWRCAGGGPVVIGTPRARSATDARVRAERRPLDSDHVWNEYFSEDLRRWVHVDPCENSWNEPLLYEKGWGKQLSYVIGYGKLGVCDVTRRYSQEWARTEGRRLLIDEDALASTLRRMTDKLRADHARAAFPGGAARAEDEFWQRLRSRDEDERQELTGDFRNDDGDASLPGRQSGSLQWRRARGEIGGPKGSSSGAGGTPAAPPPAGGPPPKTPEAAPVAFEARLKAEFDSVQREKPALSPNEAALEAIRRLRIGSGADE